MQPTTTVFLLLFSTLYFFNYIVNPLIYAVRMQEFRKAAMKLFFTKTLGLTRVKSIDVLTLRVPRNTC